MGHPVDLQDFDRIECDDGNFEKVVEEDCTGVHGCLHYSVQPEKSLKLVEKM